MRKFLICLSLFLFFLLPLYFCKNYISPNTYLVSKNLSNWKHSEVLNWLAKQKEKNLKIKVEDRIYVFAYSDLGIIFDLNKTYADLRTSNKEPIIKRYKALFTSLTSQKMILPKLIFTEKYYQKMRNLKFDFSKKADEIIVDERKKELAYYNNQDLFKIDPESLRKEIILEFGQNKVLKPKIHRFFDENTKLKVEQYNNKIKQVINKPIYVYFENKKQEMFSFHQDDLSKVIQINYDKDQETLSIGVKEPVFSQIMTGFQTQLLNNDLQFNLKKLKQDLASLISTRFNGYDSNYVYAELIEKPNTEGKYADKYIEIDLSQQKMYLWENKEVLGIYIISSGLYFPTPPGQYKILNKALNAYSSIYHVWMPYWMAFSLDPTVNAYLGIHELPYYYDVTGTEIRRPRDFLGSPHTGGCVSLDVGIAEQVYNWVNIGTPVVIYE